MSLLRYLIILGICTGLCFVAWLFVVFSMNPSQGGWMAILFFYLSLGLTLVGALSIAGALIRFKVHPDEVAHKQIRHATRQGLLFSLLIIVALLLQSLRALTWWNFVIIMLVAGFIELFFVSYKLFNK